MLEWLQWGRALAPGSWPPPTLPPAAEEQKPFKEVGVRRGSPGHAYQLVPSDPGWSALWMEIMVETDLQKGLEVFPERTACPECQQYHPEGTWSPRPKKMGRGEGAR